MTSQDGTDRQMVQVKHTKVTVFIKSLAKIYGKTQHGYKCETGLKLPVKREKKRAIHI